MAFASSLGIPGEEKLACLGVLPASSDLPSFLTVGWVSDRYFVEGRGADDVSKASKLERRRFLVVSPSKSTVPMTPDGPAILRNVPVRLGYDPPIVLTRCPGVNIIVDF